MNDRKGSNAAERVHLDETESAAAERAAFAAIGELGEHELTAVKVWVASGCEGPQPRPDDEARRVLAEKLMAALEAREATQ